MAKCQSCAILRKPCVGGIRKAPTESDTIVVRPSSSKVVPVPQVRRDTGKAPLPSSSTSTSADVPFSRVYDAGGAPIGRVAKVPKVDLSDPAVGRTVSRKRSALSPPSSGAPSSSKILRPAPSMSAINRTSSAMSSSSSMPSPLAFSTSLPLNLGSSSSAMVVDPPEDQVLLLLDAIEFSLDRGNLNDARMRIGALRKLRRDEIRNREA